MWRMWTDGVCGNTLSVRRDETGRVAYHFLSSTKDDAIGLFLNGDRARELAEAILADLDGVEAVV